MNQENTSPAQIATGVILGIVLQPLSLVIILVWINLTVHDGEGRGWAGMAAILGYVAYFGMAQILVILPLSLLMLAFRKHGVVRGLLYAGTALALLNIVVLLTHFKMMLGFLRH